jgi:hypothetical protein
VLTYKKVDLSTKSKYLVVWESIFLDKIGNQKKVSLQNPFLLTDFCFFSSLWNMEELRQKTQGPVDLK